MKQLVTCPHCQAIPATDTARFCGKCGMPLTARQAAAVVPQSPTSTAPVSNAPAPGTPLAVVSPAFDARITPTFRHRPRRIFFACTASPIIGIGLGAEPAAIGGLWLKYSCGFPDAIVPLCALAGFVSVTSLIAYIILADKLAFIAALVERRKVEAVTPKEPAPIDAAGQAVGDIQQLLQARSHQWAEPESSTTIKP